MRSKEWYMAYYQGAYDECRRLLTSVRMNKPQREIIEGEAYRLQDELKDRGVLFLDRPTRDAA